MQAKNSMSNMLKRTSKSYYKSKDCFEFLVIVEYLSTLFMKKDDIQNLRVPHLCPCHQPNAKRGLITYTR